MINKVQRLKRVESGFLVLPFAVIWIASGDVLKEDTLRVLCLCESQGVKVQP